MKKFSYIALTLAILFINSNVYAAEARVSSTSFSQALETAKSKGNFAALKSVIMCWEYFLTNYIIHINIIKIIHYAFKITKKFLLFK